jgi:hypothetical protein
VFDFVATHHFQNHPKWDPDVLGLTPGDEGGHAGELETSLMLALAPHLVRTGLMEPGYTGPLDEAVMNRLFREGAAALSANGVLGDPRGNDAMESKNRYRQQQPTETKHDHQESGQRPPGHPSSQVPLLGISTEIVASSS